MPSPSRRRAFISGVNDSAPKMPMRRSGSVSPIWRITSMMRVPYDTTATMPFVRMSFASRT